MMKSQKQTRLPDGQEGKTQKPDQSLMKTTGWLPLLLFTLSTIPARLGLIFLLAGGHYPLFVLSQNVTATASLDTNAILIGQQTLLRLRVEYKTNQGEISIDFPKVSDTILKEIEVVSRSKVQKFIPDSNDMSVLAQEQTFTITSFDSGYYAIPRFVFQVSGDSSKEAATEPLLLAVNTVQVDTTQNIMDIKPPLEVPFSWKEYLPYVYWGLGGLAAVTAAVLLLLKFLKDRKKSPPPAIVIPKIPPHVTALESLEKLKEEKLWQQGKLKQYHSGLSDIIRQYIEHRFYINAMEQVTDEIMYSFRTVEISEEQRVKLRSILLLSDLVKFAKEQPLPNENETSWQHAYDFIVSTKKEEAPVPSSVEPPQQKNTQ